MTDRQGITPYLTVNRADEAITFYEAAFGFVENFAGD